MITEVFIVATREFPETDLGVWWMCTEEKKKAYYSIRKEKCPVGDLSISKKVLETVLEFRNPPRKKHWIFMPFHFAIID